MCHQTVFQQSKPIQSSIYRRRLELYRDPWSCISCKTISTNYQKQQLYVNPVLPGSNSEAANPSCREGTILGIHYRPIAVDYRNLYLRLV